MLERLNNIFNYKLIKFNQNFVCSAWNTLRDLAALMASFCHNEAFTDWATVDIKTDFMSLPALNCTLSSRSKKIALNSKMGINLANTLNHGFAGAIIIPSTLYPGKEKSMIQIEYGCIQNFFNLPKYLENQYQPSGLQSMLNNHKDNDLKSDPIGLYQQVQLLAQYQGFTSIELPLKESPTSWQQIDIVSRQLQTGFYFARFEKGKSPITRSELINLVEALLLFVSRPKAIQAKKRANKTDAKKFIQKHFSVIVERVKKKSQNWVNNLPTNQNVHLEILGIAQQMADPCVSEITLRLVGNVVRKFLDEIGIKRQGGNKSQRK